MSIKSFEEYFDSVNKIRKLFFEEKLPGNQDEQNQKYHYIYLYGSFKQSETIT